MRTEPVQTCPTGRRSEIEEIEVTPAMIEAGLGAYYLNGGDPLDGPDRQGIARLFTGIFAAMVAARPTAASSSCT
jgi:hypothetical protein